MNPSEIIKEVEEQASEWLEMSDNPAAMVSGILAKRIIKLQEYVEFLEKVNGTIYR